MVSECMESLKSGCCYRFAMQYIGQLSVFRESPVCPIYRQNWLYCITMLLYRCLADYVSSKTLRRSPFLQNLCEVLAAYGQTIDIMSCLTRVGKLMAEQYEAYSQRERSPAQHRRYPAFYVMPVLTKELILTPTPQVP